MFTLVTVVATRVVTLSRSVAMHHRIKQSSSVRQSARANQQTPGRRKQRRNRKAQLLAWITALGGASGLVQIMDCLKQKVAITISMQTEAKTDDSESTKRNAHDRSMPPGASPDQSVAPAKIAPNQNANAHTPLVIKPNRHHFSACEEY